MEKHLRYLSLLSFLLLLPAFMLAQRSVSGQITSDEGEPLIGANILIQGTTIGTVTDIDGNFQLDEVPDDAILVISYTGYEALEVPVGTQSVINVSLAPSVGLLDEVVVVGYSKQKKVTVTGAVTQLPGRELMQSPAVDLSNSLTGRMPGVFVFQPSGEPGSDARIRIRGTNTLGNNSPLVVIDGIPDRAGGIARLNPRDIESISVLKDASAAIYGARAANGVILVTTKQGATGKPNVTLDFNQGWSQPTVVPKMSNAVEYMNIMNELPIYQTIPVEEWGQAWESIQQTGTYDSPTAGVSTLNANFSPDKVAGHREGLDPWLYPDTDWFGDAFRTWAPQSRYNLQIDGGTERVRYMASAGYVHQDAIYNNSATFYNQYQARVNLGADISDYITTNIGVTLRREDRNYPTVGAGAIFRMLMRGRPNEPEVWPTGEPGPDIENGQNPYVVTTNATGYDRQPTDYIQTNGSVDITQPWIPGLRLTLSGAVDLTIGRRKLWQTPWQLYYLDEEHYINTGEPKLDPAVRSNFTDPRLTESTNRALNTNLTAMLNYDFSLGGQHTFNILAGVTRETFEGNNFFAFRRNYISAAVDQLFAGGSLQQNTGGSAYERARLGYYGRFQYNYREKYLLEFIWRYDGSYIFPENDRFGFFPGVLVGWNVTEEPWFNVGFIDYLKVRGSYGQMGNDQVFYNGQLQEYAFLSTYGFGEYPINGIVETTLQETVLANPSFTWERANNFNIGVDGTLFNNAIDFTFEYFYNKRDQILIQLTGSTPASSGINTLLPPVNAGEVDNRGWEAAVNYNFRSSNGFRLRAGVNGGFARNEVIFIDEVPGIPEYQRQEGKQLGGYLVYQSDGVFRDKAEIEANTIDYSGVTSTLIPGDMKFVDTDGNGRIDADDRVRLNENNTPTFMYGLTVNAQFGGFDFSMLWQGAAGASLRIFTESGDIGNFLKYSHDNRWSIENPSSEHPRLASRGDTYYTGGPFGGNTYYLFSKDYIRLKNIELGYNLPATITDKISLSNLRIYVNALNLLTFAANDIYDPESENSAGTVYPQSRVINVGATVNF